jgi:hypothetical protein
LQRTVAAISSRAFLFLLSAELSFPQEKIFNGRNNFYCYRAAVRFEPAGLHPKTFFALSVPTLSNFFANMNGISQSHLRKFVCLFSGIVFFGEMILRRYAVVRKKFRRLFVQWLAD